ncbi:MAG: hypothetical protein IPF50_00605 [Proteobacteria bacterium]|nr:hypothetical protein [Pseudomonadota bacterium]
MSATAPRDLCVPRSSPPLPAVASKAGWLKAVGDYFVDAANAHRHTGHELLNLRARWNFDASALVSGRCA